MKAAVLARPIIRPRTITDDDPTAVWIVPTPHDDTTQIYALPHVPDERTDPLQRALDDVIHGHSSHPVHVRSGSHDTKPDTGRARDLGNYRKRTR